MKQPNRTAPLVAAIAIQLCLSILYIWSLFQTGIAESIFNGDNAAASLTYSIMLAMLAVGSMAGGKLVSRFSPRAIVIAGGVIIGSGFILASFATMKTPWLLWICYGGMGGLGMGFAYTTTIACAQRWYPDKKGMVTGLILSALGFGGVIFTPLAETLVRTFGGPGTGEQGTFVVLGVITLCVCTAAGFFVKNPPDQGVANAPAISGLSPGQMLRTPQYYLITLTMMLSVMGGMMMLGFAKPIAVAKGLASTATAGVLIISVCNSLGRLFWGAVSDKIGPKTTIAVLLVISGALSLVVIGTNGLMIYAVIGCIGFCYGGFLSNFPSLTADLFGARHMSLNYGMVMMGFAFGAIISSTVAGYYKNVAARDIALMSPAFFIAAGCAAAGLMLIMFVRTNKRKPA
jgi:OFA family oxalate/formate antiporter-like MFS transporter